MKDGWPLEIMRREDSDAAGRLNVFGVPTVKAGDDAVFVRLMQPELNEFAQTAVLR